MINQFEVVRNHRTGKLIKEQSESTGGIFVVLYKNGVAYTRAPRQLMRRAFGEPKPQVQVHREEFRTIMNSPNYEISQYGVVRKRSTRRPVKAQKDHGVYVQLFVDGVRKRRYITTLMQDAGFPPLDYDELQAL